MAFDILQSSPRALLILFFLTFLYFFENFDRYLIAVSPIPYIDYTSYEYSILVGPSFTLIYTIGGLIFSLGYANSQLQDNRKLSKSAVLAAATFVFSLAFSLTAACTTFWQQIIVRIVMGLSQSVITPFSTSIIRDHFQPSVCGSAFGIFNTGTYFAFALSLSLGKWIHDMYGWKAGYIWFGIIGMGCSFLLPFLGEENESVRSVDEMPNGGAEESILSNEIELQNFYVNDNDSDPTRYDTSKSPLFETVDNQQTIHGPTSSINSDITETLSVYAQMKLSLYEIICIHWWKHPAIFVACLATGIRIGGGYIWSAYTAIFFSDFFVKDEQSSTCLYSYIPNGTYHENSCALNYPYCVDGSCNSLTKFPWHNKGMAASEVETYMSWVPILGSAMGSALGGILSDYLINNKGFEYTPAEIIDDSSTRASSQTNLYVEVNKQHSRSAQGHVATRAMIAGVTCFLSLPLVIYSFFLDSPGCFLIYIGSGMIGEVYLSQTLALITDDRFIPKRLVAPAVALFMLTIVIIGGNFPLLVPIVEHSVGYDSLVNRQFQANSPYTGSSQMVVQTFDVPSYDARKFQFSMLYSLIGCYVISGCLYILTYVMMRYSQ